MTFGSLFAGIGGFDLGFERAGLTCQWQVEIDPFCQRVLAKHWPKVKRYGDIRSVHAAGLCGAGSLCDGCLDHVDVLCGGFPCQDISFAGYGAGLDGERSGLWGQFDRLVGELRPGFVVVENVAALTARGLGRVLSDLAGHGFDAEWSDLFACEMGATHARRRLFIVAYTDRVDGRSGLRDSIARAFRPLQTVDGVARARAGALARLAHPSALYRGADGVPDRMERNHAIGNSVAPDVTEWIGRRLMEIAA
jgi:DNA (cytosine-5)-methyltransferase 1